MRRTFFSFALISLLAIGTAGSVALAQDQSAPPAQTPPSSSGGGYGHKRGMDPDQQLKHMTQKLDLTADQQTQIKPILESRQQQMQQIWQDQSLSKADRKEKMTAVQQDSSGKIEAVLNDTQKQKYEAMQAEKKQKAMERKQGAAAPASPDNAPQQPTQPPQ